jgi:hypothetical protein
LLLGTRRRNPFLAGTPLCSMADTSANQMAARLFRQPRKRRDGTLGNITELDGWWPIAGKFTLESAI